MPRGDSHLFEPALSARSRRPRTSALANALQPWDIHERVVSLVGHIQDGLLTSLQSYSRELDYER
jgi:hypothetical protein